MKPFICSNHWKWNCKICSQNEQPQQQQPQAASSTPADEPPTQTSDITGETSSASSNENQTSENSNLSTATSPSTSKNPPSVTTGAAASSEAPVAMSSGNTPENSNSISPATSALISNSSLPASTTASTSPEVASTSSSAANEVASQVQKRKEPENDPSTGTPVPSSELSKRIKKTVIDCDVASEIIGGLNSWWSNNDVLNSGRTLAWVLQPDDPDFVRIHQYLDRSQDSRMPIKISSILRIITRTDELEDDAPLDFNEDPNAPEMLRMMLWHGTKRSNVSSILEDGLKLPSPNYGIFFADRIAKSIFYCDFGTSTGYLFLCDVLLSKKGEWNESYVENVSTVGDIECRSRKENGRIIPDKDLDTDVDGCTWPLGRSMISPAAGGGIWGFYTYNEFVVFNVKQVQPKFLLKVEF